MFLRQITNPNGRTRLVIVRGFRDEHGKNRQKVELSCGFLDELEHVYDDPVAHFTEVAAQMTEEHKKLHDPVTITFKPDEVLDKSTEGHSNLKNIGHAALSKIYHDLEIDYFLNNRRRYTKAKFNHNAIFKLLVFDRILFPSSKRGAFAHKHRFFDAMDFSLEDIYKALDLYADHADAMLLAIHKRISKLHKRSTALVYYDVTNYYFETDRETSLLKKGVSKEHRPDPIVQMGLFMDEKGLPITFSMHPGNTQDCKTLIPSLMDIRYEYGMKDIIIVADRGMVSSDNLSRILLQHNGYVISRSVRKSDAEVKQYVLNPEGYTHIYDKDGNLVFKYKSRRSPRSIQPHTLRGELGDEVAINERQIVFYSTKYAQKAKRDRQRAVQKALELADDPSKHTKSTNKGAAQFVKQEFFDADGNLLKHTRKELSFDFDKLAKQELFDGYYMITTNVIGIEDKQDRFKGKSRFTPEGWFQLNKPVSDLDIIEMYRGLWKIEETFKISKSTLSTRPVFLRDEKHIRAHFLICFVSLVMLRLLEYRMGGKHSANKIARSLALANGMYLDQGYYHFSYYDDVLEDVGKAVGIDFSKKYLKLGQIRSLLASTKKTS
jgi:transposase